MNETIKNLMLEAGYIAPEIAPRVRNYSELLVDEVAKVLQELIDQRVPASRYPDLIKHYFADIRD